METKNEEEEGSAPAEPVVPKERTTLDKYQAENARREEILQRETELQERKERLHAEQMLGGQASAGQAPEAKKEMSDEDYSASVMAGDVPDGKA